MNDSTHATQPPEHDRETQRRITALSILNEIGQAFSASLDLDELLKTVYQQVSRVFDTTNFFIATYKEGSQEWIMALQRERGQPGVLGPRQFGTGLTSYILQTRQSLSFNSIAENRAFHTEQGIAHVGEHARSWMGVPLIAAGTLVGAMVIQSYELEGQYSPQDISLFSTIAAQVAIAIQNARLLGEAQKRVEQTQLLLRVSEAAASTLDTTEVMRRMTREAVKALGADMGGAYLPDETGKALKPVAGYHLPVGSMEAFMAFHPPIEGNPFVEEAYRNRQTVFTNDVANDTRLDEGTRLLLAAQSTLLTPMIIKDTIIGGLWLVWWTDVHPFTDEEKQLVEGIVRQAAVAVENARLFGEAQARAEQMAALVELASKLTGPQLSQAELLDMIIHRIRALLAADDAGIWLADGPHEIELKMTTQAGLAGRRLKKDEGMSGRVFTTGAPLRVDDYSAWSGHSPAFTGEAIRSALSVPLIWQKQTLGVLAITRSQTGRPFTPGDEHMAQLFASQAAAAIENTRLFEEARTRAERERQARFLLAGRVQELDCLNDIGRKINETPTITEFLDWVAQRIPAAMQYPDLCRVAISFDSQVYGAAEALTLECQMVGSMYVGTQVVGQITIAYTQTSEFLNEESALLGDIGRRVSGYIENRQLIEQIQARARRERTLREITAHVRGSTDPDAIVRTAVRELGAALGRPTFVRLGNADQLSRPPAPASEDPDQAGDQTV